MTATKAWIYHHRLVAKMQTHSVSRPTVCLEEKQVQRVANLHPAALPLLEEQPPCTQLSRVARGSGGWGKKQVMPPIPTPATHCLWFLISQMGMIY